MPITQKTLYDYSNEILGSREFRINYQYSSYIPGEPELLQKQAQMPITLKLLNI